MAEETGVARRDVKLAVLGKVPQYFSLDEVPTLGALLEVGGVPQHMDVRLNMTTVNKTQYATIPLQEGDLVVAVPRIEGGGR